MQDNGQKLIIRMNNAWAAVETSHKKLVIARDAITQSEENLRLNRDYYRVGTLPDQAVGIPPGYWTRMKY